MDIIGENLQEYGKNKKKTLRNNCNRVTGGKIDQLDSNKKKGKITRVASNINKRKINDLWLLSNWLKMIVE